MYVYIMVYGHYFIIIYMYIICIIIFTSGHYVLSHVEWVVRLTTHSL